MVLVDPTPKELVDSLSDEQIEHLKAAGATKGVIDEAKDGLNASISTFKSLPTLEDIPLEVLTSSYTGRSALERERYDQLVAAHKSLSEQVTVGNHTIASKSSHYIQMDEPMLVADAVKRVYEKVRPGIKKYIQPF
ncbi:MAG: hypothetical protein GX639_00445 [Fibrobacter sp.]|nr:hypothetical protein [Fibrobacter sp.]